MGYILAGIVFACIAFVLWQYFEQKKFTVTRYTLPMEGLDPQKGLKYIGRFAVLSDLHNHIYGKNNEPLIQALEKEKPDFVIMAGDMLTARPDEPMEPAIRFVKEVAKRYPVYYANGNHEYRLRLYHRKYKNMYADYVKELESAGVHHLINQTETITLEGKDIKITGLEIDRKYYKRLTDVEMPSEYVQSEIGRVQTGYQILIAHNPDYFEQYAKWGADLILSGHVHGGIVRLPKLGGIISPKCSLFPKYSGGIYKGKYGGRMIVSRGLGMHTIPIRINNRAELIIVNLAGQKR